MERFIVKTAVKTVLIVLIALVAAFVVLNFAFPQHMASFMEGIGNYDLAVKYTSLRYSYTGDGYDLARCVEDSILSEKNEYVLEYGEKLIARDDFEQVCADKDQTTGFENYKQFVCGKVLSARYDGGDFDGALNLAVEANGTASFKMGNALMTLCVKVLPERQSAAHAENRKSYAARILEKLDAVHPENADEIENLDYFKTRIGNV